MQLLLLPLIIKCIIRDLCYREERIEQTFDFYAADVSGNIKVNKDGHGFEREKEAALLFQDGRLKTSIFSCNVKHNGRYVVHLPIPTLHTGVEFILNDYASILILYFVFSMQYKKILQRKRIPNDAGHMGNGW